MTSRRVVLAVLGALVVVGVIVGGTAGIVLIGLGGLTVLLVVARGVSGAAAPLPPDGGPYGPGRSDGGLGHGPPPPGP